MMKNPTYLFAAAEKEDFRKYLEEKSAAHCSIFIVLDENTEKYCKKKLLEDFPVLDNARQIMVKSGEKNKNFESCNKIWLKLITYHADRCSLLVNLGGGVITDLGGFAASSYKRGISFCNVPTTLLGMIDASIGGKTGLDYNGLKNIIGSFSFAEKTYIDPEFLRTLPERHIRSGCAELLKIALISDKRLWQDLKLRDIRDIIDRTDLIQEAVKLKDKIVQDDPLEKNVRKKLSFGHTIGHAVESSSLMNDKKPLLHGEAVAIGMVCEAWLSKKKKLLSGAELDEVIYKIFRLTLTRKFKADATGIMEFIRNDKKNSGQKINFTLLSSIGEAKTDNFIDEKLIADSLVFYNNLL
ncbi:MAG TPA: 3-dehydroquinate synthase [Bacteroidales bacterium]|nr:3-dehydroquinate synthase [Bacteroidales bacterium]